MVFLIISSIIVAIILGYITRHNVGIFAMIFAYIIGAFLYNKLPEKAVYSSRDLTLTSIF